MRGHGRVSVGAHKRERGIRPRVRVRAPCVCKWGTTARPRFAVCAGTPEIRRQIKNRVNSGVVAERASRAKGVHAEAACAHDITSKGHNDITPKGHHDITPKGHPEPRERGAQRHTAARVRAPGVTCAEHGYSTILRVRQHPNTRALRTMHSGKRCDDQHSTASDNTSAGLCARASARACACVAVQACACVRACVRM